MKFNLVDTQAIYRRLLDTPDAAQREAIFYDALVTPFQGLVNVMGGGDGLATFKQSGMSPDHFAGENRAWMASVVDGLSAADSWTLAAAALDEGWQKFAPYAAEIPTQVITFGLMISDMRGQAGSSAQAYAGFGAIPGYIMTTYGEANEDTLPNVKGATAHELHHNLLFAARPKNFMTETTVADYMIYEGLAESFAAELYGEAMVGYYVRDFDDSQFEATKAILHAALPKTGFNVIRSYIFGDSITPAYGLEKVGVPAYAGYAFGYRIVQHYLKRTGKTVVEATFIPADEIIAASGFFE